MNFDLQFYWGLFLKRLPVMMGLFLACALVATVGALKLPPTYSASARLLVEEPQIPESMVRSLDQVDAGQQLQVIEQRLLTRANLLDIARKHDVFEDIQSMTPDGVVSEMRSQTGIRRTSGRGQATFMRVSFEARSGQIAANVVNEYVTLILQESTDFRIERAENTLTFFEQEVERLEADLNAQGKLIVRFRNDNADALPNNLGFRQNRRSQLEQRRNQLNSDIATLEEQRENMVEIFNATGRIAAPETTSLSPEAQQLQQLQFDLGQALSVYSETNPRVVLLRNRIAQLENIVAQQASLSTDAGGEQRPATVFERTLAEMNESIAALEEERSAVENEIAELTISIQDTASNAIALDTLERDLENLRVRYNEAVANLERARVTERVEINSQGQRISMIENASVPQEPSGPNRFKIIATGIMSGIALAGGFFVLLELLNTTIRRPAELQSRFGIIPLAVIPYMESRRERRLRRSILVGAFISVLIGVPAVLWYIDTSYMPLDILANKIFDRLGLT